jgi:hypothetical protein
VRQLPQEWSDLLDDKRQLQETLEAAGVAHLAPETYIDLHSAFSFQPAPDQVSSEENALPSSGAGCRGSEVIRVEGSVRGLQHRNLDANLQEDAWFLKHRRGVKGQAVTPLFSRITRACTQQHSQQSET